MMQTYPDVLQQLIARLQEYQQTAVTTASNPHPNPDPGCPKTVGSGQGNKTMEVCPDPSPTPPPTPASPTPAPETFSLRVASSTHTDGISAGVHNAAPLCLIVNASGAVPEIGYCAGQGGIMYDQLWTTKNDGQAPGGIESAAVGRTADTACLKLYEAPASAGCSKWDTVHMGKCSNAQANAFDLVPSSSSSGTSSTTAGAFQLRSVQCPSVCIGTATAASPSASQMGRVVPVQCDSADATSWTKAPL